MRTGVILSVLVLFLGFAVANAVAGNGPVVHSCSGSPISKKRITELIGVGETNATFATITTTFQYQKCNSLTGCLPFKVLPVPAGGSNGADFGTGKILIGLSVRGPNMVDMLLLVRCESQICEDTVYKRYYGARCTGVLQGDIKCDALTAPFQWLCVDGICTAHPATYLPIQPYTDDRKLMSSLQFTGRMTNDCLILGQNQTAGDSNSYGNAYFELFWTF